MKNHLLYVVGMGLFGLAMFILGEQWGSIDMTNTTILNYQHAIERRCRENTYLADENNKLKRSQLK